MHYPSAHCVTISGGQARREFRLCGTPSRVRERGQTVSKLLAAEGDPLQVVIELQRKPKQGRDKVEKLQLTEQEWQRRLSPEEFRVLRQHGTEPPWGGCFLGTKDPGTYVCAGCGNPLFRSGEKFESGTGWPSFTQPIVEDAVTEVEDRSFGMMRTEVRCARCDGHLGHVFPDGPPPTGLRYCINSVSMKHVPEGEPIPLVTG